MRALHDCLLVFLSIFFRKIVFQDEIEYECDAGYQMIGVTSMTCTETKIFSSSPPTCQPVSCGDPNIVEYGEVEASGLCHLCFSISLKVDTSIMFEKLKNNQSITVKNIKFKIAIISSLRRPYFISFRLAYRLLFQGI